ncbi:MAG: glycosyltransferase family 39 protein [Bryobacterales bacterium]|nr:glycosyltransferase family 39 protein [Bryobacterales bacterium]
MSPPGPSLRTCVFLLLFLAVVGAVYLHGLGSVGLLGPDEPRYAAIGREMASSGDWVTPRLWGEPWFEKPALLYWLTAAGHLAGLGADLSPRIPVALLSLAYLLLQFLVLWRLDGVRVAWMATLVLATTAGWSAYSQIGVTDLPLAAAFNGCLLLGILWVETGSRRALAGCGFCFGLGLLAKGLVPGVLVLPLLFFGWRRWRAWWLPAAVAVVVAGPWYLAMFWQHGRLFFDDFILRHHFSRFATNALQHEQPVWFYLPVLAAALFPWPTLLAVVGRGVWQERRHRILVATFVFGLLFFSFSTNKLPGYVLPLLPPLCIVIAVSLEQCRSARRPLALAAMLLAFCPVVATILPESLMFGLRRANLGEVPWEYFGYVMPVMIGVWLLEAYGRRLAAVAVVAGGAAAGLLFIKLSAAPVLDELVSSRGLWRKVVAVGEPVCVESLHRSMRYGLNYYTVKPLPDCSADGARVRIEQRPGGIPRVAQR